MNLFKEKIRLFCVSNIMISLVCTSFLGVNYNTTMEDVGQESNSMEVASTDTEPASRLGEEENKAAVVATKLVPKVVSTKKSTTKKTTNVVTKKEVSKTVSYAPAKYSEVTGNAVVEYAKRYLGLRYVSGGNSLTKGTDCSGFTKLIYKEFGVTLSRAVKGQVGNGKYVRKSDLKKGDLVFYGKGNGSVSHVGIYMGNGQVIHESNPRDGVKISSVNMMHYITARRVINDTAIKKVENQIAEEKNKELALESQEVIETSNANQTTNVDNNVNNNVNNDVNKQDVNTNTTNTTSSTNTNTSNTTTTTTEEKQTDANPTQNKEENTKTETSKEEVKTNTSTSEVKEESKSEPTSNVENQ